MTIPEPAFTVAIAGFGWWGRHIAKRLSDHPWLRVAGIIEPNAANHADIAAMGLTVWTDFSVPLALPEIDAVVLTTPNKLHEAQIIEVAAAGKHVFCEKPLGLTADSARRSVQACADAGVQLGIGHERRYEPAMLALREALEKEELGTIMHAEATFSHDKLSNVPAGDWRTSKEVCPAAGMTAMGIHLSDLLLSFFGPVRALQAFTADRILGWETGDVVTVQMQFEAGMTATFSAILKTPHFIRMHVYGSDRWIEVINDSHPDTPDGKVRMMTAETGKDMREDIYDWEDSVSANLEAFARAARGEAPYPISTDEMIQNIQILEAVAKSAETGQVVLLSEI
ncbi:Gfo/Idh/MocA family protein [Amaricoccus macauensis]|uniref:Gfo/Idh/MocA family protein n=1 Tax=Amaricoccus macauensis TaxID=57001 RepID=UPI003C7C793C